jgi:hypothetical protein
LSRSPPGAGEAKDHTARRTVKDDIPRRRAGVRAKSDRAKGDDEGRQLGPRNPRSGGGGSGIGGEAKGDTAKRGEACCAPGEATDDAALTHTPIPPRDCRR